MTKSTTALQLKLEEFKEVNKIYKSKLRSKNTFIPHLFLDVECISEQDEEIVYESIAKEMCDEANSMVFIYETNDEPVKTQIRSMVYALSEKVRYRAEYKGIVVIRINKDFVREKSNSLFIQFLKEQGWYIIFSARANIIEVFDWVSTKIFVDEITKITGKDVVYSSIEDSLKVYELKFNRKLINDISDYMYDIRSKARYDIRHDEIAFNAVAYNAVKSIAKSQTDRFQKIKSIEELTEGINTRALVEGERVSRIGFCVEPAERG